ncbi:MAG: hypothetical protein WKG07_32250 [Hymenobacter sp.]
MNVARVLQGNMLAISTDNTIGEVRAWSEREPDSERTTPTW